MDTEAAILEVLRDLKRPIRLPTAQWLFSDLLGIVDNQVRQVLTKLQDAKKIQIDNGGWIHLK